VAIAPGSGGSGDGDWVRIFSEGMEEPASRGHFRHLAVWSPKDSQGSYVLYRNDGVGGMENQIHPYATLRDAVDMEGFAGVGFVKDALARDETGNMNVLFE